MVTLRIVSFIENVKLVAHVQVNLSNMHAQARLHKFIEACRWQLHSCFDLRQAIRANMKSHSIYLR